MLVDARTVPDGSVAEADVCVIGAGAAGITIARALLARPVRTILLESGWLTPDPATQSLYAGEVLDRPYFALDAAFYRQALAASVFSSADWFAGLTLGGLPGASRSFCRCS